MRKLVLAALIAVTLAPSVAQASTGWARYEGSTYVRWHSHVSRPTDDRVASWLRYNEARHRAVLRARHAHRVWLAAQRVVVAQRGSQAQHGAPSQGGGLHAMACSFRWSCVTISCIISRESGWNPRARNPSSGAAGLTQLMPFHWLGKFDPYNPWLNLSYAYHSLYLHSGWQAWGGACG